MKKFLLSAAALFCAATMNAQVFQLNAEDFQIGSDATPVIGGMVWGPTTLDDPFTFSNAFNTDHKAVNCKNNNYNQVVFNGTDIVVTNGGVQGQDNPKDIDGGNPGVTLKEPVTGAAVKMYARQDGYVYIVAKLSSNKNYYVFEEGTPIGFTLAMQVSAEGLPSVLTYEAKGEGELNEITDAGWCDWPENVYYNKVLGQEKPGDIKANGLGVIGFPVYADCVYLIGAGGSKISWCGAYFCEAPVSVVLQGTDAENPVEDCVLLGEGAAPSQPSEPEASETLMWDQEVIADDWKDQKNIFSDGGAELADVKVGQILRFYLKPLNEERWCLEIVEGHWNGTTYANYSNEAGEDRTVVDLASNGGFVTVEITQELLDNAFKAGGWGGVFVMNGDNISITKVTLVDAATGIEAMEAEDAEAVSFNILGQKANATNGLMIKGGKVVFVK